MSKLFLKIKIKSLACEARIIRKEEQKRKGGYTPNDAILNSLHRHRVIDVRCESRNANLAYAYLNGKSYRSIERICYTKPSVAKIARMVGKYGEGKLFDNNWLREDMAKAA
jgi:hypothetical protein